MIEKMQKNAGFCLWDLCKDMERRFSGGRTMVTPDHMAYYATFFLHEENPNHAWFFFLDAKKRLQDTLQITLEEACHSHSAKYIDSHFKNSNYFYIAHRMEASPLKPSPLDTRTNDATSQFFTMQPKYLGMILVSEALDYLYLPPTTDHA